MRQAQSLCGKVSWAQRRRDRVSGWLYVSGTALTSQSLARTTKWGWPVTFNILQRPDLAFAGLIYIMVMPAAALGFVAIARRLLATNH